MCERAEMGDRFSLLQLSVMQLAILQLAITEKWGGGRAKATL